MLMQTVGVYGFSDPLRAESSNVLSSGGKRDCHYLVRISGHLNGSPDPGTFHPRCLLEAMFCRSSREMFQGQNTVDVCTKSCNDRSRRD